jgi:hypothetical protein
MFHSFVPRVGISAAFLAQKTGADFDVENGGYF